jgi:hypothetical protein
MNREYSHRRHVCDCFSKVVVHKKRIGTVIDHPCVKFRLIVATSFFVIATKPETKENTSMAAILLF